VRGPARGPARRALPALALVALLAGCGGIPRSSDVVSGAPVEDDPRTGLLQVIPDGPARDAAAVDVVRGFLLAAASAEGDHAVAREFLGSAAAQAWRPDAGTTIVASGPDLALLQQGPDSAVVAVTATVQAQVDAAGHYAERPPGTAYASSLHLTREDGRWRITDPPDGVVVTALDASRTLRPFPVYFATAGPAAQLVGDVRWFGYDSSAATRVVSALLQGPSPWLAPGVTTGAPAGTELRVGTVPVAGGTGTASVDLSDAVLGADPAERGLLLSQLRASLSGLPGVDDVQVTVDGAELTRGAGAAGTEVPRATAVADPRPVVLGPEGLSRFEGGGLRPVPGTGPGLDLAGGASHPAVAADASAFAVLTDGGRALRVQRPGGELEVAVSGQGPLAPPSLDRFGWLWTAPATPGAAPLAVPTGAPETPAAAVTPPAEGLGSVLRVRVSRDGARLLVVGRDAGGAVHVQVHGIVRDATGKPLRLGVGTADLVPGVADVLDAAWLSDDELVVLTRPAGADPVPVLAEVSGPSTPLPAVPGAVSVAGGWSDRDLVVGTADGRLLTRSGADWIAVAAGRDPAYPG
jgi:Lipoprotein LpqB beta-propeller domain/Sporulation and spore germination